MSFRGRWWDRDRHHRSGPAALHRRAGRRCAGQRGARDRGHDPQHRAPAPGHPRHAADRGPARRRAGHLGRAGGRLHAPRLREADRGPHLPAGHHPHQPHRLARQLRQRGAVHPRHREADGGRGTAAGPAHPHHPVRAVPDRQHLAVPRRPRCAARRAHPGLLRLPRPRVRPQPDRGGDRWAVPPELRPHRRPQGRPAQGLDRRDQGRHEEDAALLRRDGRPALRQRDLPGPHPRHRRDPDRGGAQLRTVGRQPAGLRRRLGPPSRPAAAHGVGQVRLEGLDPPRRRRLRPGVGAPAGDARGHQDRRPAARLPAQRADHGQGAPHHQGARGRGLGVDREPARRDGLLRRVAGATPVRSG